MAREARYWQRQNIMAVNQCKRLLTKTHKSAHKIVSFLFRTCRLNREQPRGTAIKSFTFSGLVHGR